jgi:hypothetical protein
MMTGDENLRGESPEPCGGDNASPGTVGERQETGAMVIQGRSQCEGVCKHRLTWASVSGTSVPS